MKPLDASSDTTVTPPLRQVRPRAGAPDLSVLTSHDEVLALLAAGHSNHEIADHLFIWYRTVKSHVSHILEKLHLRDRTAAAVVGTGRGGWARSRPADGRIGPQTDAHEWPLVVP